MNTVYSEYRGVSHPVLEESAKADSLIDASRSPEAPEGPGGAEGTEGTEAARFLCFSGLSVASGHFLFS